MIENELRLLAERDKADTYAYELLTQAATTIEDLQRELVRAKAYRSHPTTSLR